MRILSTLLTVDTALVHVNTLILKARAGNLVSLIVSGTMILGWI